MQLQQAQRAPWQQQRPQRACRPSSHGRSWHGSRVACSSSSDADAATTQTGARAAPAASSGSSGASSSVRASSGGSGQQPRPHRARQYVGRKELQKQAREEYLRQFYEAADRVEREHVVFELQPASPRVRAQLQASDAHAALNRRLAAEVPALADWQQLAAFLQQHGRSLNFLNAVALAARAAALQQEAPAPPPDPALLLRLAALLLEHSSWFQPSHFASSAAALCSLGVAEPDVWDSVTAAAEHKLGAFTFPQLAVMLQALATVGFTPALPWVERCYRQAAKHLHAAEAHDVARVLWAWGEFGYTPRDRLLMNQVKVITRRAFDRGSMSGAALVQLMHGLARMPRYAPNQGWLAALAKAVQPQLEQLAPGQVVDLLLSLVAVGFRPPEPWMAAAVGRLERALLATIASHQQAQLAEPLPPAPEQQPQQQQQLLQEQQQQQLFLLPADLQQLEAAGLLLDAQHSLQQQQQQQQQQQGQDVPDLEELQQLQQLFAEASADASAQAAAHDRRQHPPPGALVDAGDAQPAAADTPRLSALPAPQQQQQQQLAPEHLGVLCWCLGRLDFQPSPAWMQCLGEALLRACPAAPGEVLLDALLGCCGVGHLPAGPLLRQLLARLQACVPAMPPEPLRRLCQGLAALEAALEERQQQQLGGAASRALAEYRAQHKPALAAAIVHRQGVVLWQSSTAQLADVLAFAAAAGEVPSLEYLSTGVSRAVDRLPEGCPVPSLVTLLWALARLGFKPHPQLLHALLAALQRGLHTLGSAELADAAWALCVLKHRPGGTWLQLFLKEVAAKAAYMAPQALTDTLWALACFAAEPDLEWLKRVLLAAGAAAAAGGLSRRNGAVVLWALAQLGLQPAQLAGSADAAGAVQGLVRLVAQPQAAG